MSESKYTIDVNQAKEILGVSRKTIYNRLKSGELDGKKVATDNTMKWVINEDDIQQAKRVKESVEVVEVEENIRKEQLIESIQEAVNSQNKQLINESMEKIMDKIDQQNKAIRELSVTIEEQQNKSLWDRIKSFFK